MKFLSPKNYFMRKTVSQNKNNAVMQYFMWRIILGLNYEIEISFMITGHTKFDCDRGFGHIKRKYLKSDCENIIDISNNVRNSSANKFSKFIRDPISKNINIKYCNWTELFGKIFYKNKWYYKISSFQIQYKI